MNAVHAEREKRARIMKEKHAVLMARREQKRSESQAKRASVHVAAARAPLPPTDTGERKPGVAEKQRNTGAKKTANGTAKKSGPKKY